MSLWLGTLASAGKGIVQSGLIVNLNASNSISYPPPSNRSIRYIRVYANGSTSNPSTHFVEIQALTSGGVNRALNRGSAGGLSQYTGGTPEFTVNNTNWQILTNGVTDSSDYIGFGSGGAGVQLDLGAVYTDISQIKFWNYYADNRTYYSVTVFVSSDGTNWTTIYGPQNTATTTSGVSVSNSSASSTWNDLSGNSNHFTLFNSPTFESNCLVFNGSNQYARSTSTLNLSSFNSVTVEVAFRANTTTTPTGMVFEHSSDWNTNTMGFGLVPNSNGSLTYLDNSHHTNQYQGSGSFNYDGSISNNITVHTNIWSKISDSTGRDAYINGVQRSVLAGSRTTGSYPNFRNDSMFLASRSGGSAFYNCKIYFLRIYNRKLSASEILQNFQASRASLGI